MAKKEKRSHTVVRKKPENTTYKGPDSSDPAISKKAEISARENRLRVVSDPGFWRSTAERIAESKLYYRGKHVPELQAAFPGVARMWHVQYFFPQAVNGPLFVEEALTPADLAEAKAKAEVLKKAGKRVVILERYMSYEQAVEQLLSA